MRIKRYDSQDKLDNILFLIKELHDEHNTSSNPFDFEWKKNWLKNRLQTNTFLLAIIEDEDFTYAGYIMSEIINDEYSRKPLAHLRELFILQKYRQKGYGTALMKFHDNWAKSLNSFTTILYVQFENQYAIHFYENLGFKKSFMKMVK